MALSTLQLAGLIAGGGLTVAGVGGVVGFQAFSQSTSVQQIEVGYVIPTRNECINDGLRQAQSKNFSRQIAYDIEVRCEQMIQSLEARQAAKR